MRRSTAVMLAILLFVSILIPSLTCHATGEDVSTTEHEKTTEYPNNPNMEPEIVAKAAIVMDAATGQILYEKDSRIGKYPASITKIMTALIVLEKDLDLDQVVTMSNNAIWNIDRLSTNIGLDVGEQLTVRDLLYAMMVKSANECAYALAEWTAGDVDSFADMMNEKAKELGCEHTHFVTPNGLHDDDHYSTAYDMALITQAALKNDRFREITGTLNYTIPATNMTDETRPLWNGNKMINPSEPYYYEYCEGGKTGYTTNANNTLMTFAKKDGLELICIILDCDGIKYTYTDTRALYNYCYNNYMYFYPLSDFSFDTGDEEETDPDTILDNYYNSIDHGLINLTVDKNFCMLIKKTTDTAAITKDIVLYDHVSGNTLGEIDFMYNGEQIGSTPITNAVPSLSSQINNKSDSDEESDNPQSNKKLLYTAAAVVCAFAFLIILFKLIQSLIHKKKQDERRRRYTSYQRRSYRKKHRKHRDDDYHF